VHRLICDAPQSTCVCEQSLCEQSLCEQSQAVLPRLAVDWLCGRCCATYFWGRERECAKPLRMLQSAKPLWMLLSAESPRMLFHLGWRPLGMVKAVSGGRERKRERSLTINSE
jgi:hypothetical protein